jgi:hypothetical protein
VIVGDERGRTRFRWVCRLRGRLGLLVGAGSEGFWLGIGTSGWLTRSAANTPNPQLNATT